MQNKYHNNLLFFYIFIPFISYLRGMETKERPYAFTGCFNMFRGRIVSEIVISSPDDASLVSTRIRALWDTGCSQSVISKRVADFLRLQPDGIQRMRSPFGGSAICDIAKVKICVVLGGIRIPIDVAINPDPNSDPDCDITLGLDFITLGDFAISHDGEALTLSFCYPPAGFPLDFTQLLPEVSKDSVVTETSVIDESTAVESNRRKLVMMDYLKELAKKK